MGTADPSFLWALVLPHSSASEFSLWYLRYSLCTGSYHLRSTARKDRNVSQRLSHQDMSFRAVPRRSTSTWRANIFTAECVVVLSVYLHALLAWKPPTVRISVLVVFGIVYFVRLNLMARYLLPREIAIEELTFVILVWIPAILASFVPPAVTSAGDVGGVTLAFSVAAYAAGSYLNTASEYERKVWKDNPEHRGMLYTQGLFALARNINYLGDVLLFAGWAAATGAWWNAWVPATMSLTFLFHHIPDKEAYMASKYADAGWPAYVARTKAIVPYLL